MVKPYKPRAIKKVLIKDSFISCTFIEHLIYARPCYRWWKETENILYVKIIRMTLVITSFFLLFVILIVENFLTMHRS